jgi:hypothetical protein
MSLESFDKLKGKLTASISSVRSEPTSSPFTNMMIEKTSSLVSISDESNRHCQEKLTSSFSMQVRRERFEANTFCMLRGAQYPQLVLKCLHYFLLWKALLWLQLYYFDAFIVPFVHELDALGGFIVYPIDPVIVECTSH